MLFDDLMENYTIRLPETILMMASIIVGSD
jgi:hypothetical protein